VEVAGEVVSDDVDSESEAVLVLEAAVVESPVAGEAVSDDVESEAVLVLDAAVVVLEESPVDAPLELVDEVLSSPLLEPLVLVLFPLEPSVDDAPLEVLVLVLFPLEPSSLLPEVLVLLLDDEEPELESDPELEEEVEDEPEPD